MTARRRARIAAAAGAVLSVVAGTVASCGVPTGGAPTTIAASDVPYGLASPGTTTSPAPTSAPQRQEAAWIYLVASNDALVPRGRTTGAGSLAERLGELLTELAAGPSGRERTVRLSTALPPDVELRVAGIEAGTATIDFSGTATAPAGGESRRAVGQIVLTATTLPGVDAVRLTSDGRPVEAPLPSGELTDGPLLPADYADLLTPPAPPASTPSTPGTPGIPSTPGQGTQPPGTVAPTTPALPFRADTRPDTATASPDAAVTVTDIRIGRHDGFDRVVLEVGGSGIPGWDVRYVDQARSQGSGQPVDVAGKAVLQVTVTGAGNPTDTGLSEYAGPDPLAGAGTVTVTEVDFDATFEGTTVAFVGTNARRPFRVYLLQSPARVVLEVTHTG